MNESQATKKFLDLLRLLYAGSFVLKLSLRQAGIPDALAVLNGRVCFIEFKQDDYPISAIQRITFRQIQHACPVWIVRFHSEDKSITVGRFAPDRVHDVDVRLTTKAAAAACHCLMEHTAFVMEEAAA